MASARLPDLEALALLLAVEQRGSLGAAARAVGITQPAASQRVRALEAQLGYAVLERTPRGSRLTDAGRRTTEWAAPLVAAGREFSRNVRAIPAGGSQLTIAASLTVADYLLPGWLTTLREALPAVTMTLTPGNSRAVADLVLRQEVAIGFVEGPAAPPGLHARVLGRDSLVLVVAPDHPWTRRTARISPAEVADAALVLREPESGTRQVLDHAMAAHGLTVRPALELGSTTSIKEAVMSGSGVAVLSRLAVRDDVARGDLTEILVSDLDLSRALRAIWHPRNAPSGPAGALLALAERSLGARAGL